MFCLFGIFLCPSHSLKFLYVFMSFICLTFSSNTLKNFTHSGISSIILSGSDQLWQPFWSWNAMQPCPIYSQGKRALSEHVLNPGQLPGLTISEKWSRASLWVNGAFFSPLHMRRNGIVLLTDTNNWTRTKMPFCQKMLKHFYDCLHFLLEEIW